MFANLVASIPAYTLNRRWSWGKSGRSHVFKEVVPFWTMTVIGIALSILTASEAHHLSNVHHLHHFGRTVVVEGANTGAFAILWVVKFLVLNRLFRVHPVAEMEAQAETELFMQRRGGHRGRRALRGRGQSRKFWNWSGMPKSCSLRALMTAWRSSRFLPDTRSCSPWVCDETPFRFRSLRNLLIFLA